MLTINNSSSGSSSETASGSYDWDGVTYTTSGVYTNTYTNAAGCDSIHTLTLTITDCDSTITVAACDSYTWNDTVYTQSGTYSYTVPSSGSGGVSSGPFIGLSLESYATKPTGETVYRLYADLDSANHTLFGLSGTAIHALTVNTTTSFFQDQFGGDIQTDINSAFIGQSFLPDLIYDSWWTLGDSYDNTPVAKLGDWTFGLGNFSLGGSTCLLYTSPSPRDKRQSRMACCG